MKTIYFTNGEMADAAGTGLTLASYAQNEDGSWQIMQMRNGEPYFGYLAKEITKEEFDTWQERISNPDMKTYFPGIFNNGVVNKAVFENTQAMTLAGWWGALTVTPRQAQDAMIVMGVDEAFDAAVEQVRKGALTVEDAKGKGKAAKGKHGDEGHSNDLTGEQKAKMVTAWQQHATKWSFNGSIETAVIEALGVDKKALFDLAKTL